MRRNRLVAAAVGATSLLAAAALAPAAYAEDAAAGATAQPPRYIVVCVDVVEGRDNPGPAAQSRSALKRGAVVLDAGDVVVAVAGRYWRRVGDDEYRPETEWVEDRYLLPVDVFNTLRPPEEMLRANDAGATEELRAAAAELTGSEEVISVSADGRKAVFRLSYAGEYDGRSYGLTSGRYSPGRILYFEDGRGLADIFYYNDYRQDLWSPDGARWVFIGRGDLLGNYPYAVVDSLYVYNTDGGTLESLGPCVWTGDGEYALEFVGPYVVWLGAEEMSLDIGGYSEPSLFLMPALYAYRFDTGERIKLLAADPATMGREPCGTAPCAGNVYYPVTLKAVAEPPPELGASPIYRKLKGAIAEAVTNEA